MNSTQSDTNRFLIFVFFQLFYVFPKLCFVGPLLDVLRNNMNADHMCLYDITESYVLVWYFSLHVSFYTLFSYEIGFSMHLVIMTSPRYYDVTHYWSDCNETHTVYVESKIKTILFMEISSFSPSFLIYKRILLRPQVTMTSHIFSPILMKFAQHSKIVF